MLIREPKFYLGGNIGINGGEDWVVPTMEFNGRWRKGKIFDARELKKDLLELGVIRT